MVKHPYKMQAIYRPRRKSFQMRAAIESHSPRPFVWNQYRVSVKNVLALIEAAQVPKQHHVK